MLVARSRLARDLRKLGIEPGEIVMVHCRMSALGHVVGGAQTVVRALLDAGRSGPLGEGTAHLFDARRLVEHAVCWIEHNFASGEQGGP
jgi:aminoglycoside N3'-acetyltransferase